MSELSHRKLNPLGFTPRKSFGAGLIKLSENSDIRSRM